MSQIYNEDATTIGFWFDENNGLANHPGIFKLLNLLNTHDEYNSAMGNPLDTWKMAIPETENYKGLSYMELDFMYLARSSFKNVREYYLQRWINKSTAPRSEAVYNIARMYSKKWLDIWETMFYDFDPIENYNMREQLTNDQKTMLYGKKDTFTITNMQHTKTGTETDQPGDTSTETDQVYAFNSQTPSNADKRTVTRSGSNVTEYNTTDTDTGSSNNQLSGTDTETRNYVLTRTGNIGVTTSQQMIEQQRKLVMYDYFDSVVFPDIDKILTLSVY